MADRFARTTCARLNPLTPTERRALRAKAHTSSPSSPSATTASRRRCCTRSTSRSSRTSSSRCACWATTAKRAEAMLAQACAALDCASGATCRQGAGALPREPRAEANRPPSAKPAAQTGARSDRAEAARSERRSTRRRRAQARRVAARSDVPGDATAAGNGVRTYRYFTSTISNSCTPPGVRTSATSPAVLADERRAIGELTEILPCLMSASSSPTIW